MSKYRYSGDYAKIGYFRVYPQIPLIYLYSQGSNTGSKPRINDTKTSMYQLYLLKRGQNRGIFRAKIGVYLGCQNDHIYTTYTHAQHA